MREFYLFEPEKTHVIILNIKCALVVKQTKYYTQPTIFAEM